LTVSDTIENSSVTELVQQQRDYFLSGATLSLEFRRMALARLRTSLIAAEGKLLAALHTDLRKPAHEAYTSEIAMVISDIDHATKHLKAWIRPARRPSSWITWPSRAAVVARPLGVALIIGPWNYPVQLTLLPLVGAISAGNCSVVKPSEFSPATSAVIASMLNDTFPAEYIRCVEGDRAVAAALLKERFDKIFFTGSTTTGRAVATAAAAHLTPVTLELGGKCPVIVCRDANLRVTARRIIWGKTFNAGQSCVAPDYVLADATIHDALLKELSTAIVDMLGNEVQASPHFGRVVNRRHFDRLAAYLGAGTIIAGGELDAADLFIAPTLVGNVSKDSAVMTDEIFGPILPVLPFEKFKDAINIVNQRPSPLAAYLFTSDKTRAIEMGNQIRCGGLCVNDVMVHLFGKSLPFGGVGCSGMGSYHGKASFDCFSHQQTMLHCSTAIDLPFRYAPPRLPLSRMRQVLPWLLRR
jgi:aldehyde dehydrogenase (NAD+)